MNDAHAAGELKLAEPVKTALSQLEQLARGEDVAWFVPPRPGSKYVDRAELHAAITAIDSAAQLVARLGETHLAGTPMAGALRGRLAAVDWGLVPIGDRIGLRNPRSTLEPESKRKGLRLEPRALL